METFSVYSSVLPVVFVFAVVLCACASADGHDYFRYGTGAGIVEGKLNVHLVPHSHVDVGWLKTVDQYYVGSNNSIQGACVENVLDSVVAALHRNPHRKFIFGELAFFERWWAVQRAETQKLVRKLVDAGQFEFVNGGWVMHDEATCHYIDMIDQTTLGHQFIKKHFGKIPRAGWQIDPFGHSAVQAYLLGAELGFDSVHFARIDYQDRDKRKKEKSLEVIWRGSKTFGSSSQIFANAFPEHYSAPPGFEFEVNDDDLVPVQDNPFLYDYNVKQRVNEFIDAAVSQANVTRSNHVMWTMGDDFKYQYAESWFKQMDKLIHYVNKDGQVNALYSTPSIYTDAKHAANQSWPLKTNDFFPYADKENAYWTGFFTSRPSLKGYVRMLSGYYLAARQLEFLVGRRSSGPSTFGLGDALGTAQHHDGLTGTAKQHTTNDYVKRLAMGAAEAEAVVNLALSLITCPTSSGQCARSGLAFSQCQLLNISFCPATEEDFADGKGLVVVVYNPLGWNRTEVIKLPVNSDNFIVQDAAGNDFVTQYIEMDNVTINLRKFHIKAYLGMPSKEAPRYWIFFQVSLPPLGWSTYFISKANRKGESRSDAISVMESQQNRTVEIGPGRLKMSFSLESRQLKRMFNSKTGADIPLEQSYFWYNSHDNASNSQPSGAYIFRPDGPLRTVASKSIHFKVVRGSLVDEVHQQFNSWINQVTRLYKDKEHADVEFTIGPIPMDDGIGKEVVARMVSGMATGKLFYTDSNGRDFLKRVRDGREDWPLSVNQPVAGNYYPLNLGIFTVDQNCEFSVLVDRAVGGASIKDGEVELMLHRRLMFDDSRGVGEALNETVCAGRTCKGLVIRGNYYMSVHRPGKGAKWRRKTGQEIYSPPLVAFTHEKVEDWKGSRLSKATLMDPNYSLPPNVALITLQELDDGSVVIRLAHLFEAGEDALHSAAAKVELKRIFGGREIKKARETSLSANQERRGMRGTEWRVEGQEFKKKKKPTRGDPLDEATLVVELGPMEIRTFLLEF